MIAADSVVIRRSSRVLVYPIVGAALIGGVLTATFVTWLFAASEPISVSAAMGVLATLLATLSYGILRSWYWNLKAGAVVYRLSTERILVTQGDREILSVPWSQVSRVRIEGRYGWRFLMTAQTVDQFPQLVVHAKSRTIKAPNILLWGSQVDEANSTLERFQEDRVA